MSGSDGSDDWGEEDDNLSDTDEDDEWDEPPPPPRMGMGYNSRKMVDNDGEGSITPIRSVDVSVTKVDYSRTNPLK